MADGQFWIPKGQIAEIGTRKQKIIAAFSVFRKQYFKLRVFLLPMKPLAKF